MVGDAYAELCRGEMEADKVPFVTEMVGMRRMIQEKRKRIAELLGIPPLDMDEDFNVELNVELKEVVAKEEEAFLAAVPVVVATVAGVDGGTNLKTTMGDGEVKTSTTTINNKKEDPLSESILLLRRETPKLEALVSQLQECVAVSTDRAAGKSSMVDVVGGCGSDDDPLMSASGSGGGGERFRLASRVKQEDGAEIEIFERL